MDLSVTGALGSPPAEPELRTELPSGPSARQLTELLDQLRNISFPTLGHFLEEGFCSSGIRAIVPGTRMVGMASTARIPDADAVAVNQALLRLQPGEVLVLDMGGDRQHAPVALSPAPRPGRAAPPASWLTAQSPT
ncbi:hypothetical protein [Crystallibacter crystallopoietes]|uniref:RraA family protein n=1 Tax=Crystallibacter crystallopoietes TaxID=37928 RepID=UPI0002EBF10D|nr:hypothetical protein [Arthrobacter crystallopoietes]